MTDADRCRANGWGPGTILEAKPHSSARYKQIKILCVGTSWVFFETLAPKCKFQPAENCHLYELADYRPDMDKAEPAGEWLW